MENAMGLVASVSANGARIPSTLGHSKCQFIEDIRLTQWHAESQT